MNLRTRTLKPSLFLMVAVISGCSVGSDRVVTRGFVDTVPEPADQFCSGAGALPGRSGPVYSVPETVCAAPSLALLHEPRQVIYTTRAPLGESAPGAQTLSGSADSGPRTTEDRNRLQNATPFDK